MGVATQSFDILTRVAIGNGSMIYKAVDKTTLRHVALKLLPKESDMDFEFDAAALFEAAPQLRSITGNHVCQLLDAFDDDDGRVLVYEFAPGVSGAEFPTRKRLDASQAVDIAAQLMSALRSGERQRAPHGDLKPSNIVFVDLPDGRPFVFVLDWGLAAFRSELPDDSLPFAAPERLAGNAPSHQADLFSAGATLFYLLTNQVLAHGESAEDVAQAWTQAKPELLASLRPDLPAKFVQWVVGLLALDPQSRPASAVDANTALAAFNPPAPIVPPESIRPRPLSASQRAVASGVMAPPKPRAASAPTQQAVSGALPANTQRTTPYKAVAPKKPSFVGTLLMLVFLAAMVCGGYWWSNREKPKVEEKAVTPSAPFHRYNEATVTTGGKTPALAASPAPNRNLIDPKMKASASDSINAAWGASNAIDGDMNSRWATPAGTSNCSLEIDLLKPTTFSRIEVEQEEPYANRVEGFRLQYQKDGAGPWTTFHEGTSLGAHFSASFPAITASKIRLHIFAASEGPTISEVRIFAPEN